MVEKIIEMLVKNNWLRDIKRSCCCFLLVVCVFIAVVCCFNAVLRLF
jgi:TRAP-type C4-dicarboxylate transport system permease large subunit